MPVLGKLRLSSVQRSRLFPEAHCPVCYELLYLLHLVTTLSNHVLLRFSRFMCNSIHLNLATFEQVLRRSPTVQEKSYAYAENQILKYAPKTYPLSG